MTISYTISRYTDAMRGRNPSVEAWTSVSDIGKSFNGQVLPVSDYLSVEDRLVEAASRFAEEVEVETLVLTNAFTSDDPRERMEFRRASGGAKSFVEGQQLGPLEACDALRYMLREELGGVLKAEGLTIYAGFDFYLHIDVASPCPESVERAIAAGLTVSEGQSEA